MSTGGLILIVGVALSVALIAGLLIWFFHKRSPRHRPKPATRAAIELPELDTEAIQRQLAEEGRDELEKVVGENAAFIQQDVRRATSELNGYMQQEITRTLDEELKKYHASATNIGEIASDSIARMQTLLDERYIQLSAKVDEDVGKEKERIIARFDENMAEVVGYYVKSALGDHLDVSAQLNFILQQLEDNKAAMIEDIRHG